MGQVEGCWARLAPPRLPPRYRHPTYPSRSALPISPVAGARTLQTPQASSALAAFHTAPRARPCAARTASPRVPSPRQRLSAPVSTSPPDARPGATASCWPDIWRRRACFSSSPLSASSRVATAYSRVSQSTSASFKVGFAGSSPLRCAALLRSKLHRHLDRRPALFPIQIPALAPFRDVLLSDRHPAKCRSHNSLHLRQPIEPGTRRLAVSPSRRRSFNFCRISLGSRAIFPILVISIADCGLGFRFTRRPHRAYRSYRTYEPPRICRKSGRASNSVFSCPKKYPKSQKPPNPAAAIATPAETFFKNRPKFSENSPRRLPPPPEFRSKNAMLLSFSAFSASICRFSSKTAISPSYDPQKTCHPFCCAAFTAMPRALGTGISSALPSSEHAAS